VLIEDLDGAENALFPIRELQTKRKIIRTVPFKNTKGETRSVQLIVEGPVSIAGCTTKENLYEDNANRSFLIHIDESTAQDEKIMEYQRRLSAGKIDLSAQQQLAERFRNMQRILVPMQIRNPYAEQLKIPKEVLRPRRTNAHYLAFIEAVTFYHQYQREKQYDRQTGEEYIETTIEDIRAANRLMKEVLLRKADALTVAVRNYFEHLKEYLSDQKDKNFTNRQIRQALRIKAATLKRYHSELSANGLLQVKSGKKATGYVYQVTSFKDYEQLQERIHGVLDQITGRLEKKERRPGGPVVAHRENEPPKEKKAS
jgi:hypothetical protein